MNAIMREYMNGKDSVVYNRFETEMKKNAVKTRHALSLQKQ
jgi:hypothetical protein